MDRENDPLVTAVIPVYNHERYVIESIRSIIRQTYRNIELIVINDGSTDRSHEMVLTVEEECRQRFPRFEYLNRENIGLAASLNQALAWARGKYISVMASDDVALPNKIETLLQVLEKGGSKYAVAFGNALFIDDAGNQVCLNKDGRYFEGTDAEKYCTFYDFYAQNRHIDFNESKFGSYRSLIEGNYLPAMSNLISISAIRQAGRWTDGNLIEDWEMWLALSKKLKFGYVAKAVALYRWHNNNISKIARGDLLLSSLSIVSREKEFCYNNGFREPWDKKYTETFIDILTDNSVSFTDKFSATVSRNVFVVLRRLPKRALKRLKEFFV